MKLLHFASGQKTKFSPFVKELIREKFEQKIHESESTADPLKEILMELTEIKKELQLASHIPIHQTTEIAKNQANTDERDLSGLADF